MSSEPTSSRLAPAPADVSARLRALRTLAVIESDGEARARLHAERPTIEREGLTADAVRSRLAELRALCELAEHLRRAPAPR
ncbi:MAG TPA: hypothetical protein VHU40_19100 [Polyangia bacterium]|nr:hypothetical protein [Polyangia bacterium]